MRTFVAISKVKAILCCLFIIGCLQSKICAQQFPGFINPGLEGKLSEEIVPPDWSVCEGSPDTQPGIFSRLPPSQGNSYVGFVDSQFEGWEGFESFGEKLCEPLKKGISYSFMVDLAVHLDRDTIAWGMNGVAGSSGAVEIYGGNSSCAETELLATSIVITDAIWKTTTITFTPKADYSYVVFHPLFKDNSVKWTYLLIDNIRPLNPLTDTSICAGDSIKLSATGGTSYSWSPGAQTTSSITVAPTTTTTYSVAITNNCNTITQTVTVTVKNCKPSVKAKGGILCKDSCLQLNAVGSGGKGPYTYLWQPGNLTGESPNVCPQATTVYTVTLTDADGKTASDTATVTLHPSPIITASGGSGCPGDSIQLSANGADTYSWSPALTLINPLSANPIAFPSNTTTYTVTGSTAGCKAIATATVTISNTLLTTISKDTSICIGTSFQLLATGGKTYSWSPVTGLSNPAIANPVATPTVTTSYEVVISSGKCTDTRKVTITVNPLPVITATSATVCEKEKATLTASGATTYKWITPAGILTGSPITVTPDKTTTYTVIGTDKGCSDTAETTVTVNPLPILTVSNATICSGVKTTLSAKGAFIYTWLGTNGTILSTDSTLTVTPTATTSYTVVGTNAKGCKNTKVGTITVYPIPDITTNGGVVCLGKEFQLEAQGNVITYVWNASDSSQLPNKALVIVVPTTNTTYTVTGSTTYCSDTAIAQVNVNIPPIITVNNGTICEGEKITLTANGGTSYVWSTGATTNSITVNPKITSTYLVTGINNNCFQKVPTTVIVNKKTDVYFSMSPKELTEYTPTVTLTNESLGNQLQYEWSFGDDNSGISFLKDPAYTYSQPGTYTICLKASDALTKCADSACHTIIYKPEWNVYVPNAFTPNTDDLNETFKAKGRNLIEFNMMIFDRWGNKVFESNDIEKGWDGIIKGNTEMAPEGVYVWKITCRDILKKQHQYIGHVTLLK